VKRPDAPPAGDGGHGADTATLSNRLQTFVSLLTRWNPTIRLVSNKDNRDLWNRHIEDALQLAPMLPPGVMQAIDLGSGGGLPGIVLAIATGVHFDLIEADSRKAAFLREAVLATQAPATVHAGRIEEVSLPPRPLLTARALAPLPQLLDLAKPLLAEDGVCLFPKGERVAAEIEEAERRWSFSLEILPSRTAPAARILRISQLRQRTGTAA
jgi:16S rRNA (guanine527-N7)-methyltransferase